MSGCCNDGIVGGAGLGTSTGVILVLFILLVIVSRACLF
ncbi:MULTISPECIES: YjcZ family sporulation protein [Paenibacillus]|nr:YjcZ family sporulation protein [Paenibacillus anaericanus]